MPDGVRLSPVDVMSPEFVMSMDWPAGLIARIACRSAKSIEPRLSIVIVESAGSRGRITRLRL